MKEKPLNPPPIPMTPTPSVGLTEIPKNQEDSALAMPPRLAEMLLEDQGSGTEDIRLEDRAIPRLAIMQALSDQLKKTNTSYLPEAEVGDIYDPVEKVLYPGGKGIRLVFISFRHTNLEFILRSEGGGFIADHGGDGAILKSCTKNSKGAWILNSDATHEVVPTKEYFCFLVRPDLTTWPVLVSMSKSQVKHSNRLNSLITQRRIDVPDSKNPGKTVKIQPAMFYTLWDCTTAMESNDQGEWAGWNIVPGRDLLAFEGGAEIYLAAREYKVKVDKGEVKVQQPAAPEEGMYDAAEAPLPGDSGKVPF